MEICPNVANKISLVLILCVVHSACTNLSFLVENLEKHEYYCITNTSSALSWIDKDTNKAFNQVSDFIPSQQQTIWKIDCKDDQLWKCAKIISNQTVLDRRWEEMTIYQSKHLMDEDNRSLEFTTVADNLKTNFEIPFSIRIDIEAHIFLCDGNKVGESNCYWVILEGFFGDKTAIKKCSKGEIPIFNEIYASCKIVAEVNHVTNINSYLNKQSWNHLKLSTINNKLSLTVTNNKDPIIYYNDDNMITVTHMIIHSKHDVGLWKIHELEYLHTTSETTKTQLGQVIHPIDGAVCISMFIDMCYSCHIKFQLTELKDKTIILKEELYHFQSDWREIQVRQRNINAENVTLLVTTVANKGSNDHFWSIGYIKQCHDNGYRMIKLNETAKCQFISDKNNDIVSLEGEIDTTSASNVCKEDTVSDHCVPCSWFMDKECGQLRSCEKEDDKIKCSCSAGYTNQNSSTCNSTCDPGHYSHKCQKTCGNCTGNCNNVDGTCDACTNNYSGPKCDIPPANITVTDIAYTEASVRVSNFDAADEPLESGGTPPTYVIQCQISNNGTKKLTFSNENFKLSEENVIKMNVLESGTRYSVSCFVTANGKPYYDNRIPTTNFTTKCDGPYDFITRWTLENELEMKWKHPNRTSGGLQFFSIILKRLSANSSETPQQITVPVLKDEYKLNYYHKVPTDKTHRSTKYEITIIPNNNHNCPNVTAEVISPPSIPLFETQVKIFPNSTNITVEIPSKIKSIEAGNIYKLLVFVTDKNSSAQSLHPDLEEFKDSFRIRLINSRIVFKCDLLNLSTSNLTIGNGGEVKSCADQANPPLVPGTDYNVTVIVTNTFGNTSRCKIYSFTVRTTSKLSETKHNVVVAIVAVLGTLVLVAVIVTIGWKIYLHLKKGSARANGNYNELISLTSDPQL